jgi:hypothetical protein
MTVDSKKNRGRTGDEEEITQLFTDEVKEAARDLDLSESVIRAGGDYRQHRTKEIFWLPLDILVDFEQADTEIKEDAEFWEFFSKLIVDKQLKTKSERTKKATRHWGDWKSGWDDWKPTKIGKWWSNWGYNSSSWGTGDSALTKQLLLALKAVTATVSVINDTGQRFVVRLAQEEGAPSVAYTDFSNKRVVISPQALLDTSIESDVGIEVTTGWGLHEASHIKYTMSLLDALTKPTVLRPKSVAGLLHNILEDLRIETLTGQKFPGFKDYFTTGNEYLWETMKENVPATWGPDLKDKVNAVIAMAKWPSRFEATAQADPSLASEWPWWRAWAEDYVDGKEPIRMGVVRALERLAEDEETAKQMDELTKQEEELESQRAQPLTDDEFKELMDQLKKLLDNGIDPCPSPGHQPDPGGAQIELTHEQAEELEKLIEQQYQTFEATYKMHDGPSDVAPQIEVTRPQETDYTKMAYEKPGGMAQRLREAFYFRKKLFTDPERLLKSGFVDDEQLWRVGVGDTRVFERDATPEDTYTSVTMLVDASGSMIGSGLAIAQDLSNVMLACLRTQRGARARVRAHTTGANETGQTCQVFRIWEPGDPDTRLGLLQNGIAHSSNFDGFAIDWCARELFDNSLPGESMLLIVLSDGLPAGTVTRDGKYVHYGGEPAMDHMMEVSVGWGRKGVHIVQIAIDPEGVRPEDQARMFQHWIGYESDQKLLTDLTRVLTKTFGGVE